MRKVARLNANILYLCYTQGVQLSLLSPAHTLGNIQHLLNTNVSDLGRFGAVNVTSSNSQMVSMDFQINDLTAEDSETDGKIWDLCFGLFNTFPFVLVVLDDNSFPNEWEAIPHLSAMETISAPQQQLMTQQQTVSMAGGLVNNAVASVTSIWRGFTGR